MRLTFPMGALLLSLAQGAGASLPAEPARLRGTDLAPDGSLGIAAIEVESDRAGVTRTVLEIEDPPVGALAYAIEGTVGTTAVEGEGHLEMWSCFPDGSCYFSRTAERSGPLGVLAGTAAPRPFALPFSALGLGAVALALGQPYAVWYPLLLLGVVSASAGPFVLRAVRKRFAASGPGRTAGLEPS
jgi:hypothetical protein